MKHHLFWIGLLSGMLLLASCTSIPLVKPQPTSTPGPLDLVKAFADANNRGDIEAVMALFVQDNPSVNDEGIGEVRGVTDVRKEREFMMGLETKYQFNDCKIENKALVTCTASTTNAATDAWKTPAFKISLVSFNIINNHILELVTQGVTPSPKFQELGPKMDEWMKTNYPEDFNLLMGPLETALTREVGEMYAKRIREFAKTLP